MFKKMYQQARSIHDKFMDQILGIDTISHQYGHKHYKIISDMSYYKDSISYASVPYSILANFINHIDFNADDVIFDIGCGAGRVLCWCAHKYHVKLLIGIDISRHLGEIATANLIKLRHRRTEYEIQVIDACKADYDKGTIYIFYNPFGPETLLFTLDLIKSTLSKKPRNIQILYIGHKYNLKNPDVIENQLWLKNVGQWSYAVAPRWKAYKYVNI